MRFILRFVTSPASSLERVPRADSNLAAGGDPLFSEGKGTQTQTIGLADSCGASRGEVSPHGPIAKGGHERGNERNAGGAKHASAAAAAEGLNGLCRRLSILSRI